VVFFLENTMRIPFRFRPSLFNTCFVAAEATLTDSGVGSVSPGAESVIADSAASPAASETSVAQVQTGTEQSTGDVTATDGQQQAAPDIFEGIPTIEELQQQAQNKVPLSEGLLRLRTELERVKPELQQYEPWKPIITEHDPEGIKTQLATHQSIFSPLLKDGQPVLDDRNLPRTTAQPFLEQMEAKRPGFAMDHFLDVLEFPVAGPNGQRETLFATFFRDVLGLDGNRLEQYQNIDKLIAQTNGNITQEELNQVPEGEREAYKLLPSKVRSDWPFMEPDEKQFHLNTAKELLESRQFREQMQSQQRQAEQEQRKEFEAQVQETFNEDLATVRTQAFASLRDNLAKVWQPSTDDAINQDRYDDVLAPLIHLIDPDLQPMALKRLEREGIKINAPEFNQNMQALVGARATYVRAQAYGDAIASDQALRDFNRLQTQMMAKFNTIVLQRAQKYGYQAQQIAEKKGEMLTTASAVRPIVPGNGQVGLSPSYVDPRSREAVMADWQASRTG
jgi:hypothetical protein